MGCHTWVYGRRKPYDAVLVKEKAKELYKQEKSNWKLIKSLYLGLSEKRTIDILNVYVAGFNLADEFPIGKERSNAFEEWKNTFTNIYGKNLEYYISYIWYSILSCDEESISEYRTELGEHIRVIDKSNRKYYAHMKYFYHTALEKVYDIKGLFEILEEESMYAVETEYHDPFRVYGYPENVLKSRQEAEDFLFDRDSNLFMTAYDWGKPKYEAVDKKENYDLFVKLITHQLDIIYKDVPDAVITFG